MRQFVQVWCLCLNGTWNPVDGCLSSNLAARSLSLFLEQNSWSSNSRRRKEGRTDGDERGITWRNHFYWKVCEEPAERVRQSAGVNHRELWAAAAQQLI